MEGICETGGYARMSGFYQCPRRRHGNPPSHPRGIGGAPSIEGLPPIDWQSRADNMSIVDNRKATHDYFIEERFEAGLVLEGWEVKAIRAGHVQLKESYVIVRDGEIWILGMHISPLPTASTHIHPNATRTRKLLLKAEEISKLIGKVEQRGYTLVPLNLHYKGGRIKLDFGLGRGKKLHDKRDTQRDKDWAREKERLMKHDTKRG